MKSTNSNKASFRIWHTLRALSIAICLTASLACKQQNSAHHPIEGQSESGGGNVSSYNASTLGYEGVRDLIELTYAQSEKLIISFQTLADSIDESNSFLDSLSEALRKSSKHPDVDKLLEALNLQVHLEVLRKTQNGKGLLSAFRKLESPDILLNEYCVDKSGNSLQGHSFHPTKLCFSAKKVAEDASTENIRAKVEAIVLHELGHKAGLTEVECKYLELYPMLLFPANNWPTIVDGEDSVLIYSYVNILQNETSTFPRLENEIAAIQTLLNSYQDFNNNNLILRTLAIHKMTPTAISNEYVEIQEAWELYLQDIEQDPNLSTDMILYVQNKSFPEGTRAPSFLRKHLKQEVESTLEKLNSIQSLIYAKLDYIQERSRDLLPKFKPMESLDLERAERQYVYHQIASHSVAIIADYTDQIYAYLKRNQALNESLTVMDLCQELVGLDASISLGVNFCTAESPSLLLKTSTKNLAENLKYNFNIAREALISATKNLIAREDKLRAIKCKIDSSYRCNEEPLSEIFSQQLQERL